MKKLTLEQTEFAKSIGATHYCEDCYFKGGGIDEIGDRCSFRWDGVNGWVLDPSYEDVNDPYTDWPSYKIDYSCVDKFSLADFGFAVEQLVEYCHNLSIVCGELDTVERMLKEMWNETNA